MLLKYSYLLPNAKAPSFSTFKRGKPKFVKRMNYHEDSNCFLHSNMNFLFQSLKDVVHKKQYHCCGTTLCPNWQLEQFGADECFCVDCVACKASGLSYLVSLSWTKLIEFLCCKNGELRYPRLQCWQHKCMERCGVSKFMLFIDGSKCKGLRIDDDEVLIVQQLMKSELIKGAQRVTYQAHREMKWLDFKRKFIMDFEKFMPHHVEYVYNFRTRRDWVSFSATNIPFDSLYIHLDYINAFKVKSQVQCEWTSQARVAIASCIVRHITPTKPQNFQLPNEPQDRAQVNDIIDDLSSTVSAFSNVSSLSPSIQSGSSSSNEVIQEAVERTEVEEEDEKISEPNENETFTLMNSGMIYQQRQQQQDQQQQQQQQQRARATAAETSCI